MDVDVLKILMQFMMFPCVALKCGDYVQYYMVCVF
jgi:hypothetical protein